MGALNIHISIFIYCFSLEGGNLQRQLYVWLWTRRTYTEMAEYTNSSHKKPLAFRGFKPSFSLATALTTLPPCCPVCKKENIIQIQIVICARGSRLFHSTIQSRENRPGSFGLQKPIFKSPPHWNTNKYTSSSSLAGSETTNKIQWKQSSLSQHDYRFNRMSGLHY